ncbi:DUF6182 family protein [Streptomyces sp. CBMAI 2042]|uniref:DUF6182 family protein n=1 Tax=Streptomyces sp. CBMAI 2042 TaxID=2305222 RepID=UPI000F145243|nr:DUF6182 family protein [Streptomyces sp. CBMAI 2042]RLV70630.1 hypothetical protein STAN_6159 [Streptomyces sp. CBMAI 2042]
MSGPRSVPSSEADLLAEAALVRAAAVHRLAATRELDVAVVVSDLDVGAFIRGAAGFALSLPGEVGRGWHRTFTRTVFLSGRPTALAGRHPYHRATPAGDLAWYGPAPRRELRTLSRLLRAFQGPAPIEAPTGPLAVTVPGPGTRHQVEVALATDGVSTAAYLVHAHHLIAEAALRGLVRPGDTLRVEHRGALRVADFREALAPVRASSVQTRIAHSGNGRGQLRLYGVLTSTHLAGGH